MRYNVKLLVLSVFVLGLVGAVSPVGQSPDMTAAKFLNNLKTEYYSGKPVDIDLEDVGTMCWE